MKIKKILSTAVAAAMAVTTFSAFSITGNAAVTEITSGDYEVIIPSWSDSVDTTFVRFSTKGISEDDVIEVKVTIPEGRKDGEIAVIETTKYDWQKAITSATGAETLNFTLADVYEKQGVESLSEIVLQYWNSDFVEGDIISYSVSINGDYVAPTTDVWTNNGDGTYTYLKGDADTTPFMIDLSSYNEANILSITVDYEVKGGANGCLGVNDASKEKDAWTTANWDNNSTSVTLDVNGAEGDAQFQLWWCQTGTEITIKNITVFEKDQWYIQETAPVSGKKAVRFVKLITKAEAEATPSVDLTINNGKDGNRRVTLDNCYNTVSAAGEKLTAPEGYVFVAYAIKNVPENINLTIV